MTYRYAATCLFGLEKLLGSEIDGLGYKRTETIDGRVIFEGDESAAARANIFLRTAERVFLLLGDFRAETFTELFDGTKALPWGELIGREDAFPVKGHSIKSRLASIPDCQKIVKKAIVDRLSERYGIKTFRETGVKHQIEFFILKDRAMLMIDLTGTALHKRGYRPETYEAPIRETLAAGYDIPPARGRAVLGPDVRIRDDSDRGRNAAKPHRSRQKQAVFRGGYAFSRRRYMEKGA